MLDKFGDNDLELNRDCCDGKPMIPDDDKSNGAFGINGNFELVYMVNPGAKRYSFVPSVKKMSKIINF